MDRLQRAALITKLVQALRGQQSWAGETHVQKAAYLLQEMLGVPLDYPFVLYKFGPYSFDFRDEITALRGDDLLRLEFKPPYGPRYDVCEEQALTIQGLKNKTLEMYNSQIEFVANKLGARGVSALERLATAYYVMRKLPGEPPERLADEVVRIKPHVTHEEAIAALSEIKTMQAEARKQFS